MKSFRPRIKFRALFSHRFMHFFIFHIFHIFSLHRALNGPYHHFLILQSAPSKSALPTPNFHPNFCTSKWQRHRLYKAGCNIFLASLLIGMEICRPDQEKKYTVLGRFDKKVASSEVRFFKNITDMSFSTKFQPTLIIQTKKSTKRTKGVITVCAFR